MKFLVVISACLAVSYGSILPIRGAYGGHYPGYAGPLADVVPASTAVLVGHPNGAVTPADTPAVVAARADHLATKGAIYAAQGPALVGAPAVPAFASGPVYAAAPAIAAAPALAPVPAIGYAGYVGPLADAVPAGAAGLVSHPNGAVTPADTPSVVAARADHLASRGAAYAASAPVLAYGAGYGVPAIGYAGYVGPLADAVPAGAAGLVSHPNGAVTPADTPSVVAARADHLASRGAAYAASAPVLAYGAGYGVPAVAGPAFAAPAIASPAIAAPALPFAAPAVGPIPAPYAAGVVPVGAGSPTGALVTFPNGAVVPADEPSVVAARAEHLAAKGPLGW